MKIKSLLLGSAIAMVGVSGAQAADAIIYAEPEPLEYVRICDAYGAGFFYIPGTETCLRVGGYLRFEGRYWDSGHAINNGHRWQSFSRAHVFFDARNETEWGTLRSFAETRFQWQSTTSPVAVIDPTTGLVTGFTGGGSTSSVSLNQGFIELQQAAGTWRLGKSDSPYSRFLGYAGPYGPIEWEYAFRNTTELSYTFNGGNGFSAIIAATDASVGEKFDLGVEGGVKWAQGWGSVGAIAGYDTLTDEWGARASAEVLFAPVTLGLTAFYSSGPSVYGIYNPVNGFLSEWSAVGYAGFQATDTLSAHIGAQWFDDEYAFDDDWHILAGLDWRPVSGLRIRPEVRYATDSETWTSVVRFDRSF